MSARVATCPKCVTGKVAIAVTPQCLNCGRRWLSRADLNAEIIKANEKKTSYLHDGLQKDLEKLVAEVQLELLTTICQALRDGAVAADKRAARQDGLLSDKRYYEGWRDAQIEFLKKLVETVAPEEKGSKDGTES